MRLLLVDDEVRFVEALSHTLKNNDYVVDTANDGAIGLALASRGAYDVIILDRMLSGCDGMSILKELRSQFISTPILFLTARDSAQDRVAGLDAGADDYLVKPFSTKELLARLRALSRRQNKELTENVVKVGSLTLNPTLCEAISDGKLVSLTAKESLLLELLMRNAGQVLTKERILYKVWSYTSDIELSNVDLYIHYIRKKLTGTSIKTIRGVGYCLQEANHVSKASS